LHDLAADPSEQRNLFRDPGMAGKREELLRRLFLVSARPHSIPQYRNLPLIDGRKWFPGGKGGGRFVESRPIYDAPESPFL